MLGPPAQNRPTKVDAHPAARAWRTQHAYCWLRAAAWARQRSVPPTALGGTYAPPGPAPGTAGGQAVHDILGGTVAAAALQLC